MDKITEYIDYLRDDTKVNSYDEITTKQTIILKILHLLSWNVFSLEECIPEYSVGNRRVDYNIKVGNKDSIFIEVKKPSEDLDKHQEQLLDYAFRQGVSLAILTNGITWWFYLPTKKGNWNTRKFYTIDIKEQDSDSVANKFKELLSKENVISGEAITFAEKLHNSRIKEKTINDTLPEAWNKIISDPESLLIDLLSETTERLSGYRPTDEKIKNFLIEKQDQIILDTEDDVIAHKRINQSLENNPEYFVNNTEKLSTRSTGTIIVKINEKEFKESSIPKLYYKVLKYVVDNNSIQKITIPWGIGRRRYFVYKGENPTHPSNRKFFSPVKYKNYYLESHVNRKSGVKYLGEFCIKMGYKFKVIEI